LTNEDLMWENFPMKFVSSYNEGLLQNGNLTDCILFSYYDNMTSPDLNFVCTFSSSICKKKKKLL